MSRIETAIAQYRADYGMFPSAVRVSGDAGRLQSGANQPANSDIMMILMARETYPDGRPVPFNSDNERNPRKVVYMDLRFSNSNEESGLGPDGNYRDPWGNPYMISMDLDGDGYCSDSLYSDPAVSVDSASGRFLVAPYIARSNEVDRVEWKKGILIWSKGPDGQADPRLPANKGVNADNVLSWEKR